MHNCIRNHYLKETVDRIFIPKKQDPQEPQKLRSLRSFKIQNSIPGTFTPSKIYKFVYRAYMLSKFYLTFTETIMHSLKSIQLISRWIKINRNVGLHRE